MGNIWNQFSTTCETNLWNNVTESEIVLQKVKSWWIYVSEMPILCLFRFHLSNSWWKDICISVIEIVMHLCETDYLKNVELIISKEWNRLFKKYGIKIDVFFMKQASGNNQFHYFVKYEIEITNSQKS